MPELPEVETIRRCLEPRIVGGNIGKVWIKKGSRLLRDTVSGATLKKNLEGKKIEALGRRGKYLIAALDSGHFLVIHLGMTGVIYVVERGGVRPQHTHIVMELDKGDLVLSDPRTFGRVIFLKPGELQSHPALAKLGPEPLDDEFTGESLWSAFAGRTAPVKALLLDQKAVAGVGNIYADESCFRSRLLPSRQAGSLSFEQAESLAGSIKSIIRESIEHKGCTIRDYQWDAGRSGDFSKRLKVYGKEGKTCPSCKKDKIIRTVVAGRGTFFCPTCQK